LERSTHMAATEWVAPMAQRHDAENASLTKSLMVVQVGWLAMAAPSRLFEHCITLRHPTVQRGRACVRM